MQGAVRKVKVPRDPKQLGFISRKFTHSQEDLAQVEIKLGYKPTNMVEVAARCPRDGTPTVLKLYPLRDASQDRKLKSRVTVEPFPTLYWLIDNELKYRISLLEDQGWVKKFEERLDKPTLESKQHLQVRIILAVGQLLPILLCSW
jgi:hypothetical protein